jgi:hypothetical protein
MRLLVAFAIALIVTPAGQGAIVIQGDTKLGRFAVQRDGTLQGAIEAFGDPATLRRHPRYRVTCYAGWPDIGLRITFYNLGGENPCTPQWGYFSLVEITGEDWRYGERPTNRRPASPTLDTLSAQPASPAVLVARDSAVALWRPIQLRRSVREGVEWPRRPLCGGRRSGRGWSQRT